MRAPMVSSFDHEWMRPQRKDSICRSFSFRITATLSDGAMLYRGFKRSISGSGTFNSLALIFLGLERVKRPHIYLSTLCFLRQSAHLARVSEGSSNGSFSPTCFPHQEQMIFIYSFSIYSKRSPKRADMQLRRDLTPYLLIFVSVPFRGAINHSGLFNPLVHKGLLSCNVVISTLGFGINGNE